MHPRSGLDFGRFEALTFDCYGTLIDWEAGLADAFRPILVAHDVAIDDEDVLRRFAGYEAAAEAGPYQTYRHVLAAGLRGVAGELGFEPSTEEIGGLFRLGGRLAGVSRFGRCTGRGSSRDIAWA